MWRARGMKLESPAVRPPGSGKKPSLQSTAPSTSNAGLATNAQIERALFMAEKAQKTWKQVPVADRAAILRRMAEWCVARADELATELTWQMGRPVSQTPGELKRGFHERALYMCDIAEEALKDLDVGKKDGFQRFIRREPLGVVLVIAPWNYPWLTSVNAVVPALLAGNSVILKMAAQTPLVAERYAEAFKAVGLPPGVFQFLHMDHAQVARTIADPRIAFVAFTGLGPRWPGGAESRGRAVHRHRLELGGKDPAYVPARCGPQLRRREPGGRGVFQLRPVVLRHRADLRAQEDLYTAVRRRLRPAHPPVPARQSRWRKKRTSARSCAPRPQRTCARRSSRRSRKGRKRSSG